MISIICLVIEFICAGICWRLYFKSKKYYELARQENAEQAELLFLNGVYKAEYQLTNVVGRWQILDDGELVESKEWKAQEKAKQK